MASNTVTVLESTNSITITWYSKGPSETQVSQTSPNVIQINALGPRGSKGEKGEPGQIELFDDLVVTGSFSSSAAMIAGYTRNRNLKLIPGSQFGITTNPTITSDYSRIEFQRDIFMGLNGGVGGTNPTKIFFDSLDTYIAADTNNPENLEIHADNDIELRADGIVHANSIISASGFTGSLEGTSSFSTVSSKVTIEGDEELAGGLVFALRANSGEVTEASFKSATGRNPTIFTAVHPIQYTPNAATEFRLGNSGRPGGINFLNAAGEPAYIKTNNPDLYIIPKTGLYLSGSNITALTPFTASIISASGGITGSLEGTSSFATTASFALNIPPNNGFPFSGAAEITGSLDVNGDISSSGAIYGNGQYLTGIGSNPFPYTGSALVSGSFAVTGSFGVHSGSFSADTGSFLRCNAEQFVSTGTGVPKISSAAKLILSASTSVQIENLIRLNPTTTESITSPENGNIICDSSTNKFRGYINGAWVDFH